MPSALPAVDDASRRPFRLDRTTRRSVKPSASGVNLLRTSALSFISASIKMVAGFIVGKAVAVIAGPAGLATVGQFQNFVQIMLTAAKGGLDTGITKYVAEYGEDEARRISLLSTAAVMCAGTCALVSSILIVGAQPLSRYFLYTPDYSYIVRLFGLTVFLFVANNFLLAVVNGLSQIRIFIIANIAQSILTLLLTIGLITWLGLDGALIALATNQSLVLLVLVWMLRPNILLRWSNFRHGVNRADAVRLFHYSAMATISAIAAPLTAMLVRDQVVVVLGQAAAGYWQGMWYVTSAYLTVVTTSLAVYYLPKLSATIEPGALRAELGGGFAVIMPIVIASALTLYLLRDWVVRILFTDAFAPMTALFGWMLIGDVVKLASWLLSYLMLAKAMTRAFIVTEIVFSAIFVGLASWLVHLYGLEGVTYAYTATYALYLAAVACITRHFWLPIDR